VEHISEHLKAHTANDSEFRSLIGEPRMGKVCNATVCNAVLFVICSICSVSVHFFVTMCILAPVYASYVVTFTIISIVNHLVTFINVL